MPTGSAAPFESIPTSPPSGCPAPGPSSGWSASGGAVIQRAIRFGKPYTFVSSADALPVGLSSHARQLAPLLPGPVAYGFETAEEVAAFAPYLDRPAVVRMLQSPSFRAFAPRAGPMHIKLRDWLLSEAMEIYRIMPDPALKEDLGPLQKTLAGAEGLAGLMAAVEEGFAGLTRWQTRMFALDANREIPRAEGRAAVTAHSLYGYHLTKVHNLPGIAVGGLDPGQGASDRGSLAMSTKGQQVGSTTTSTGVVAFGVTAQTFRPYINQFEDRRQMIEGAPPGLKPVILRFSMTEAVRRDADELPGKGIYDYMDQRALNTQQRVEPGDIEALSANGWMPLRAFIESQAPLLELRSGDDNAREGKKWGSDPIAIFDQDELGKIGIDLFAFAAARDASKQLGDVELLESIRDQVVGTFKGFTYTFRGATMQTSGHRGSWHYALSVRGKPPLPEWLGARVRDYQQSYAGLAAAQLEGLSGRLAAIGSAQPRTVAEDLSGLAGRFDIGRAPGEGLNCLLETLDQLRRGTRAFSPETVQQMRVILTEAGFAPHDGMIDLYGGAGMQLANDLNVRIQVYELTPAGVVEHPVLGTSGRLVHILHTPGHFQPLWPR